MSAKDPWSPKGVAISLSASRRAALKAFADSAPSQTPLTPAQALYSLIDLIAPAGEAADAEAAQSAEDEARGEIHGQGAEGLQFPAALAAPSSAELSDRLRAIESRVDGLIEAMLACAHAVESVATSLAAAERPIIDPSPRGDEAGVCDGPARIEEPSARPALLPKDWIRAAWNQKQMSAAAAGTIALTLVSRTPQPGGAMLFRFSCAPWPCAENGERADHLPDILVFERESGALALLTTIEPSARLVATFERARSAWTMRIGRLGARGVIGAPLYRCAA